MTKPKTKKVMHTLTGKESIMIDASVAITTNLGLLGGSFAVAYQDNHFLFHNNSTKQEFYFSSDDLDSPAWFDKLYDKISATTNIN